MDEIPPLIVIVEDDAGMRRAIERLLRLSGFATRAFESAEDVGLVACAPAARCLVLDVQLPGASGPAFYSTLAEPRPPAVFITAFDGRATRLALSRIGLYTLLSKPFLGRDLLDAITRETRYRS